MSLPPPTRPAPTSLKDALRQIGPGLIISASIVGSGELIVTPKLGASAGFTLLWFIILGCILKVFLQIELGRFTLARGLTTLETLNLVPGPRVVVSWMVWFWLLMFATSFLQIAGMVGGVVDIFSSAVSRSPSPCSASSSPSSPL